jgi:signal transduction histidine kinase
VAVSYLDGELGLAVENDLPPCGAGVRPMRGGGRGLPGLAERTQLLGGRLQAGPRPDGGFAVRAWLPVSQ